MRPRIACFPYAPLVLVLAVAHGAPKQSLAEQITSPPMRAIVTYYDGRTVQLTDVMIHYSFGESDSSPQGLTVYWPTKIAVPTLHLSTTQGDVTTPLSIPLKDIRRISIAYDTKDKNPMSIPRIVSIELLSGQAITDASVNCRVLAKKEFVFGQSVLLVGRTSDGGEFSRSLPELIDKQRFGFAIRPVPKKPRELTTEHVLRVRQAKIDFLKARMGELVKEISFLPAGPE